MRHIFLWVFMLMVSGNTFAGQVETFLSVHQNGSGKVMLENMEKKSISAVNREQLMEAVMTHAKNGVPSGPLVDKVNEGLQKNVPANRIVGALSKVAERYTDAAKISDSLNLDKKNRETVIANFAHSMAAGLKKEDVARIAEAAKKQNSDGENVVELSSLTKTASRAGVPSADVAALSVACVEEKMNRNEIMSMRQSLRQSGRYGNPTALAQGYKAGISKGYRGGTLSGYAEGNGSGKGTSNSSDGGSGSGSGGNGNGGNGGGSNGNGNGGPK